MCAEVRDNYLNLHELYPETAPDALRKLRRRIEVIRTRQIDPVPWQKWERTNISYGREHGGTENLLTIPLVDMFKNTIAIGSPGCGKTNGILRLLMHQMFMHPSNIGGAVFDVKGNLYELVEEIAHYYDRNKSLAVIGPGKDSFNILYNPFVSNAKALNIIQATMHLLTGAKSVEDASFIDKIAQYIVAASRLCEGIGLIPNPQRIISIVQNGNRVNPDDISKVAPESTEFVKMNMVEWRSLNADLVWRISSELTRLLGPLIADGAVKQTVGNDSPTLATLDECIQDGRIVAISMPRSFYGSATDVFVKMLKVLYFDTVVQRLSPGNTVSKERPTFFICDEYQEFISTAMGSTGDEAFYSVNRETKCMCIVATQNINSLYISTTNPVAVDNMIANFQTRVVFNTNDERTMRWVEGWSSMPTHKLPQFVPFQALVSTPFSKGREVKFCAPNDERFLDQIPAYG